MTSQDALVGRGRERERAEREKLDTGHGHPAGWCLHYRGFDRAKSELHTTCGAGVEYAQFKGAGFHDTMKRKPCFLSKKGEKRPDAMPCPHLLLPTRDDIVAWNAFVDGRVKAISIVQTVIQPWRDANKGKSAREVIDCPVCKTGNLHLSIAALNGHVHAQCETKGCVSWME
jgi:hypothetical protein